MTRFIITGALDSGKTVIIPRLELDGFSVVEEAATAVTAVAQARGTALDFSTFSASGRLAVKTGVFAGSHGTCASIVVGNIQGSSVKHTQI